VICTSVPEFFASIPRFGKWRETRGHHEAGKWRTHPSRSSYLAGRQTGSIYGKQYRWRIRRGRYRCATAAVRATESGTPRRILPERFWGLPGVRPARDVIRCTQADTFRADKPRLWSEEQFTNRVARDRNFDLHPDGQRFAVLKAAPSETQSGKVVFISNFLEGLRK
jgi:hypothetical protein